MTPSMIGLGIGAALGVANFLLLRRIGARHPNAKTGAVLKAVAALDLILMPAIGWAIGAFVFERTM